MSQDEPKPKRQKQQVQAKGWCFTLNNPEPGEFAKLRSWCQENKDDIVGWGMQEETGAEGTPHIQGHFGLVKKDRSISLFKRILGHVKTHFEVRRGTVAENQRYCLDVSKRSEDGESYTLGYSEPLRLFGSEDLRANQRSISEKYNEPEDPKFGRKIHWYWEADGGWGKTILAKYMVDRMGAYVLSGKANDAKYAIANYIQSHGGAPKIIILDVPRCNLQFVSYQVLEEIKNGLFFSGKYEGGMCRFNSPHVLVFANEEPDEAKLSADRWEIIELQ